MIKAAAREQLPVVHPENPGIAGVTIAQLSGRAVAGPTPHRKNAVIVSTGTLDWERPATWTGVLDRSPCGTGTCAKMAALHAKGQLALDAGFRPRGHPRHRLHRPAGRRDARRRATPAVVPTLSGQAWITGFAQYVVDPDDPFPEGFTVGDLWA